MVAQTKTKADARTVADKPVATGRKGLQEDVLVDNKDLLDDQVAAAAVVDAEQSEALAAPVAADGGILPTAAPTQSIGEIAQAPVPTTTDTTDTSTTATTPAPVEETTSTMSPWAIGGIALLGVGAIAVAANSGDDDDNPAAPPAGGPPPAPSPGPSPGPSAPPPGPGPGNVAPTSADKTVTPEADGATPLTAPNFVFADANAGDVLTTVRIGSIDATAVAANVPDAPLQYNAATGHGYEFVTGASTWEAARDAALAKGGHLAILDTPEEMLFIQQAYNGLGGPDGTDGTWVGASQGPGAMAPGDNWTWLNGTVLPGDSELWNDAFGGLPLDSGGGENGEAQYAAVYNGLSDTDTKLLYDNGTAAATLPKYLIEYDASLTLNGFAVAEGQTIAAADLAALSWNSLFNTGGTVKFAVGDNAGAYSTPENTLTFGPTPVATDAGASQSVSTLIDDQHLSALA